MAPCSVHLGGNYAAGLTWSVLWVLLHPDCHLCYWRDSDTSHLTVNQPPASIFFTCLSRCWSSSVLLKQLLTKWLRCVTCRTGRLNTETPETGLRTAYSAQWASHAFTHTRLHAARHNPRHAKTHRPPCDPELEQLSVKKEQILKQTWGRVFHF